MQFQEIAKLDKLMDFNIKDSPPYPIVVPAAFCESEAVRRWSPEYLISLLGSKDVKVGKALNGIHKLDRKTGSLKGGVHTMPFKNYITKITSNEEEARTLYLQKTCIQDILPMLHKDINVIINTFKDTVFFYPDIWIGNKYSFVPLHFDEPNNFLAQIYGEKRVLLFSPKQSKYLYMHSSYCRIAHTSHIDIPVENNKSCLSRFPKIKNTQPVEVILKAGDLLYIPPYWWHQVQGLSVNISVTHLWKHTLKQVPLNLYLHLFSNRIYKKLLRN